MRRSLAKSLSLLLCLALLATAVPAPVRAADPPSAAASELDDMINADSKMRVGKIVIDSIKEDRAAGRSIDFGKIKDRVANKPLMTHFLLEQAGEQGGNIFQFALNGACPPFGLIAGTVIGSVMGSLGGSIGYETSRAMERGEKLTARQMIGTGLKSIDLPTFIGRNAGSVIGATIGQALIPIPFLGMVVGGMAGGILGGLATKQLRKIGAVDRAANKLQVQWEKVGQSILDGGKKSAPATPQRIADAPPAANGAAASPATSATVSADPLPVTSLGERIATAPIAPGSASSPSAAGAASPELRAAHDEYIALHARYTKLAGASRPDDPAFIEAAEKLAAAQRRYLELLGN